MRVLSPRFLSGLDVTPHAPRGSPEESPTLPWESLGERRACCHGWPAVEWACVAGEQAAGVVMETGPVLGPDGPGCVGGCIVACYRYLSRVSGDV